jgi:hypothetical protein
MEFPRFTDIPFAALLRWILGYLLLMRFFLCWSGWIPKWIWLRLDAFWMVLLEIRRGSLLGSFWMMPLDDHFDIFSLNSEWMPLLRNDEDSRWIEVWICGEIRILMLDSRSLSEKIVKVVVGNFY